MTLHDRIIEIIASEGPIPVSTFMTLCLHDPDAGYYSVHPGLGRDFITAPEISQVFGELIGLWAVQEWHAMGAPKPFILAEFGPGRGTLMADALRAARGHGDFLDALELCLVEASPKLRALQAERLGAFHPVQIDDWRRLPGGPLIAIGNEFLDCLPARQFVRAGDAWTERVVGLDEAGALCFGLAPAGETGSDGEPATDAAQCDLQPALGEIVDFLAAREAPFRSLFIDYGPMDTAPGDTLRAFRDSEQVDPLGDPGHTDLTVDVDFSRFKRLALARGLSVAGPIELGSFLQNLGIQARLDQLVEANRDQGEAIYNSVSRLVDPQVMGERFKAICLSGPGLPPPTAF